MPLVSTPVKYRLKVFKGANLQLSFTYKDVDGNPVNLTDCTVEMEIRPARGGSDTPLLEASSAGTSPCITLGGAAGTISVDVPYGSLDAIPPTGDGQDSDEYYWDMVLQYADGTTREILFYGPCDVIEKVTVMT